MLSRIFASSHINSFLRCGFALSSKKPDSFILMQFVRRETNQQFNNDENIFNSPIAVPPMHKFLTLSAESRLIIGKLCLIWSLIITVWTTRGTDSAFSEEICSERRRGVVARHLYIYHCSSGTVFCSYFGYSSDRIGRRGRCWFLGLLHLCWQRCL